MGTSFRRQGLRFQGVLGPQARDEQNNWRLIVDLRCLNQFIRGTSMQYETLKNLRSIGQKGDWMFSFDLRDGFYALGIQPEYRDYFTVNIRGEYFRMAGLPMGYILSPYTFCRMTDVMTGYLRTPPVLRGQRRPGSTKKLLKTRRRSGVRMLPFVDDFLFLARSRRAALELREQVLQLWETLGLERNEKKGVFEPTQVIEHLGMEVDMKSGVFRAPPSKLRALADLARHILCVGARRKRAVPARLLASLGGKAQFLYLAIPAARFYLRELHVVVSTKASWGAKIQLSRQLIRDLEWWRSVPAQNNGRNIFRTTESAFLHTDSSDYGWGAVLNETTESRGYWGLQDREEHITFKELKAVRHAVEVFLPQLQGRDVLLHEDNQAVVSILTHLTSRSPAMMCELRKLWFLLDSHDIRIRPQYIRSAANVWADRLSRETDEDDWQLNPRLFRSLDRSWGPHTIDRFASSVNKQLPRFNSRWLQPGCEAVNCLDQPSDGWRQEVNWCNPPWCLLDLLHQKLRESGARATVVAPAWPGERWHQGLSQLATAVTYYPPSNQLFTSGQTLGRYRRGAPRWGVHVFHVPLRPLRS